MIIIATNIAEPKLISLENEIVKTGIFKKPVSRGIYLNTTGVKNDEVSDKKVHGGTFKACYLFSQNYYKFWQNLYPNLNWDWGMFGENVTVLNLNEKAIHVGSIYKIGGAIIQITQPREPCYKFGVKFGNQDILEQFVNNGLSGTYAKVIKPGFIKKGDRLQLIKQAKNSLNIHQFFKLIFSVNKNKVLLNKIANNTAIPLDKRKELCSV